MSSEACGGSARPCCTNLAAASSASSSGAQGLIWATGLAAMRDEHGFATAYLG